MGSFDGTPGVIIPDAVPLDYTTSESLGDSVINNTDAVRASSYESTYMGNYVQGGSQPVILSMESIHDQPILSIEGSAIQVLDVKNAPSVDAEDSRNKRKRKTCMHGRDKGKCRECGGVSFCIHQRYKYTCIECEGPGVCIHKRRKAEGKECKGGSVCVHNRIRRRCGDCGGKAKCEHKRLKWQCKDCHGSSICHHKKRKHSCELCKNEQMRLNAAAVLLELPGLEKSNTDAVHVGHNGIQNVPSIGGVVSSSTSMGEDYSYRSGDGFFAQTMEPSP